MASDLKSGAIQLAIDLPAAQIKGLQSDKSLDVQACEQKAYDYLCFNCYQGPSGGNPVLRDPKFRQALNWAVNKEQLISLAYEGYGTPGSTLFEPNFYDPTLDWHWTPPAGDAYDFDLQKASNMLTAAGYPLRNGVRLNKQGKPIVLRLWARTDSSPSQVMGKLITGWFSQLGLNIKYSVQDVSVLEDGAYNYVGKTFTPNFDMYIWLWQPSGSDPGRRVGYYTTSQIQKNNDCAWSDPQYDKLFAQQSTTLDPQKRKLVIWQMEKVFYEQTPYIILDYPKLLEGWNIGSWQGWERIPEPNGAVAFITDSVDNYSTVGPRTAAASGGGMSAGSIVAIGAIAVICVAIIVVVLRRRNRRTTIEEAA
jgi:peptide/nickel transport system substrate-binding protein